MKKNRFYVDYENVHDAGLEGLDALKAEDEVYVFYSTAAKSIHMDKVAVLTNSPAKVQLIEADTGTKNSLDFQLLTFLFGKMEEGATHIIISGDKGFEAAIKMAERVGLPTVKRTLSIKDATAKKGGIAALTHALAVSLGPKIRVNSISPGWIDTEYRVYEGPDAYQQPAGRVGNPLDIADMVLYLCSDKASFITGENICIDGGMSKLMIYHNDNGWFLE